jgi:calcineurin-like phosphoesterase family protein
MNTWFTSDTHYNHANIIRYSKRPFSSVDDMNGALIANYNAVVRSSDNVYILGDMLLGDEAVADRILSKLNGRKHLVFGNHDRMLRKNKKLLAEHFIWAKDMAEIKIGEQNIVLNHYSMRVWNKSHYGAYQLYGHSHGSLYDDPSLLSMDVGVDPNGYYPISFDSVQKHMATKTWAPIDHHGTIRER